MKKTRQQIAIAALLVFIGLALASFAAAGQQGDGMGLIYALARRHPQGSPDL